MIVTAYTDGDRRTLTNLLAPEVYEGFEAAMRRREDAGEIAETRLLSIDAADITAAAWESGRSSLQPFLAKTDDVALCKLDT
jgi:predicted lipid-binding transport protein (Tim44 family)